MDSATPRTINTVLSAYYPVVRTLRDYVTSLLGQGADATQRDTLTHETDTLKYRKFLQETIIATRSDVRDHHSLQIAPPVGPLREVVERGQINLLRAKLSTKNILTIGYRLGGSIKSAGGPRLVNFFINTTITVFQLPEWTTLYERLGVDITLHLLTETSIFIALPNECFCQVAGEPLIDLPVPTQISVNARLPAVENRSSSHRHGERRKSQDIHPDEPPRKRLRLVSSLAMNGQKSKATASQRSPVQVNIPRLRVFYRRPDRVPKSDRIAFGFPTQHALNQLAPSQHGVPIQARPDKRKSEAAARHLSKHMFPRQFGLPNVFESSGGGHSIEYNDHEAHIKALGNCKTPKRVKPALDLIDRLLWRHSKCGYKPLLTRLCPSKIDTNAKDSLDETVILEMMAESSSILYSQAKPPLPSSIQSSIRDISAGGVSSAAAQAKHKPRFAEFMCSYADVFRFVVVVTKTVIPTAFWGSKHNFKLITRRIKEFISMRRYETFTLHTLLQGFRISDCEWLMPNTPGAQQQSRVSVSNSLKRLELLQEFMFWYFDSFLIPLIRTNFYVTESGAFRNKVLYFRQDDWETLCKPLVQRLCTNTFQHISTPDAEEILRQRRLGFSFVRLLPKETGVRPIVNLKRKNVSGAEHGQYAQSINQIMSAAFHILTYEKESQKHLLGASVFGQNEIYTKLKEFKMNLSKGTPDGVLPKLYFVKVDVQACFDTIDQMKLLEILKEIISEDEYLIQRHGQVSSVTGKVRRNFVKIGMPGDDHPHFIRTACQLAEVLRHTMFTDQVLYPSTRKREILQLLEQHITDNIVKIGDNYYRQVVGIPQGSILSSLLCSFFYGDLERTKLRFTEDKQIVMLRLIDDYMFVTTNLEQAKEFLRVMNEGHPEYGCFISQDKTLTNFEDESMPNLVDLTQNAFPWCGFRIDMTDLSVSIDYGRFNESYLQDSLTVDFGRRAGASFVQKMLQLARSKSHIIFTDQGLNSSHTILKNIYENFLVTAMKMHYYLRSWKFDARKRSSFLTSTIRQMIRYAYSSMRNKAMNKVAKASGGKCEVSKAMALWLGTHAFHSVLSCKPETYQAVLRGLEFDLSLPQYRRLRKRTKRVIKEGLKVIRVLSF